MRIKPIIEDDRSVDIQTKELENVFGFPIDYTELTMEDAKNSIKKLKKLGHCCQNLEKFCETVMARKRNHLISRSDRVRCLGQGFSIPAFVALLKPLAHFFKSYY